MKVNKLKTLLYCLGAGVLLTTLSVDAASLSVTKSSDSTAKNAAKYEIHLDATDGEISNLTITFDTSNPNIKPQIRKADNLNDVVCGDFEYCTLSGTYNSKIKIADVTLENTTETTIDNLTLSASSTIGTVSSDPISLQGKEVTTTKAKSTKAELSNLTVSVGTLSPTFSTSERNYTISGIKDTVNSVTFSTTCENCTTEFICIENCTVSENKNNRIMLEDGANTLKLVTKSEDGKNTLEYNFTVYRGEVEEPSAYLKELKIKDVELSPKFDMLLNDYSISVDLSIEKLEIEYELEDPEANVEIKGADKLVEGENTVTITVTSSDGKSKQVYTITVNKEDICDPETEECDKEEEEPKDTVVVEKKKNNKTWLIVLLVIIALLIIGVSGFFIFKKKKKDNDKNDKNNKSGKGEKIKNMIIEPETEENELKEENIEEIDTPKVKPSVDDALLDLMKTKEIELNNL